jgi:hypothetical protein
MEKLKEVVLKHDFVEGEVRDDSPITKAGRTATEAQAKAKSAVEHIASQIQLPFGRGKAALEQDPGQTNQLQSMEGLEGCSSQ